MKAIFQKEIKAHALNFSSRENFSSFVKINIKPYQPFPSLKFILNNMFGAFVECICARKGAEQMLLHRKKNRY